MAFSGYIKSDTETFLTLGPVVAVGDGFTPVTTLTLAAADEAYCVQHNTTSAIDLSTNWMTSITNADGYYSIKATSGLLTEEGRFTIQINDDSLCLPVRTDFMIVHPNFFNSLFAPAGTDLLQVNVSQVANTSQTGNDNGADINTLITTVASNAAQVAEILTDTGTTLPATHASNAAQVAEILTDTGTTLPATHSSNAAQVASILTDTGTTLPATLASSAAGVSDIQARIPAALSGGNIKTDVLAIDGSTTAAANLEASAITMKIGTVSNDNTTSSATVIYCSDITEATSSHFNGKLLTFNTGALVGEQTDITGYKVVSGEGEFTVTELTESPADNDVFVIQ